MGAEVTMGSTEDPSYPPIFRQPNLDPDRPRSPRDHQTALEIPLMDLKDLDASMLGGACREWGIFRLVNHGIPPELSDRLMDRARGILSAPFESKRARFENDPIVYIWGTPALNQRVRSLNWVEGLHIPLARLQSGGGGDAELASCPSSSFRYLVDEYGRHMSRIARKLLGALTIDLKLDIGRSASYLSESNAILRAYRYLRRPDACSSFGMDAHRDSSVLSILNQDEVGGLQIIRDGRWFDVAPITDTLIVNLGDMMQAISDDEYKSVEHRVVAKSSEERISLCYFGFPSEDGLITSSRYKAFTYKEFRAKVEEDIEATGFKVGLDRFRIGDPS